jgi:hypothetical protein
VKRPRAEQVVVFCPGGHVKRPRVERVLVFFGGSEAVEAGQGKWSGSLCASLQRTASHICILSRRIEKSEQYYSLKPIKLVNKLMKLIENRFCYSVGFGFY